MDIVDQCF